MSVRGALRRALVDFYYHSWLLLLLNTLLSGSAIAILIAASYSQLALLLLVLLGPVAAALMHCTVTLAQTDELRLGEGLRGLRLHWRRGLGLGVLGWAVAALGAFALVFYARSGTLAIPLAILVFYLLLLFGVFQLALWPLAVLERERPFLRVLGDAAVMILRRPKAWVALAIALVAVNLVGIAAAALPFLTLTIAYSFLAAAHFVLPPRPSPEG
jgi:hypothetical protein